MIKRGVEVIEEVLEIILERFLLFLLIKLIMFPHYDIHKEEVNV